MRGSAAESRGNVNSYKGDNSRSSNGYTLKPASQGEKTSSGSHRSGAVGNELRLGKLQVVVWLGLSLGSIAGAYFVGYFSGRYVGFESARESSAADIPKLPVPEVFQGNGAQNPGSVYDKLKAPAVLRESASGGSAEQPRLNTRPIPALNGQRESSREESEELALDTSEVEQRRDSTESQRANQNADADASATDDDIEAMVGDNASGPQLIIGADPETERQKIPNSMRMLGSGNAQQEKTGSAKVEASAKSDKSPNAILDERIASARGDAAKTAQQDTTSGGKVAEQSKGDGGPLVRKVLPTGYFAQVAAPKKLSEAESIASKLKRSGFPVVVESASVAGQSFYRVLVGPEQNKVQADRLVSQLKSESYLSGDPFLKKVK